MARLAGVRCLCLYCVGGTVLLLSVSVFIQFALQFCSCVVARARFLEGAASLRSDAPFSELASCSTDAYSLRYCFCYSQDMFLYSSQYSSVFVLSLSPDSSKARLRSDASYSELASRSAYGNRLLTIMVLFLSRYVFIQFIILVCFSVANKAVVARPK